MTLSTSAVAVCCCSASWVSLNSRVFSIAIRAWSRKDLGLRDLGKAEAMGALAHEPEQAHTLALSQERQIERGPGAEDVPHLGFDRGELDERPVRHVNHRFRGDGAGGEIRARIDRILVRQHSALTPPKVAPATGRHSLPSVRMT